MNMTDSIALTIPAPFSRVSAHGGNMQTKWVEINSTQPAVHPAQGTGTLYVVERGVRTTWASSDGRETITTQRVFVPDSPVYETRYFVRVAKGGDGGTVEEVQGFTGSPLGLQTFATREEAAWAALPYVARVSTPRL